MNIFRKKINGEEYKIPSVLKVSRKFKRLFLAKQNNVPQLMALVPNLILRFNYLILEDCESAIAGCRLTIFHPVSLNETFLAFAFWTNFVYNKEIKISRIKRNQLIENINLN